jgi:hypothetical protein
MESNIIAQWNISGYEIVEIEMMNVETQSVSRLWSNCKRKARRRREESIHPQGELKDLRSPSYNHCTGVQGVDVLWVEFKCAKEKDRTYNE